MVRDTHLNFLRLLFILVGKIYLPRQEHRCQGFWFVWSEKCNCPEGAIVRPGGPNF